MMKFKHIFTLVSLLCLGLIVAGCSNSQAKSNPRTKIVFWHEMAGPGQVQLMKFVHAFNHQQNKYEVVPEFEGNYNEVISKILQTNHTNTAPAVFQSMDVSTNQFYHSKMTVPVQKFIDQDHYSLKQIMPAARSFYSYKGQQLSMPFNTSQPVLYYNASLLKRLGIKQPPVSPSYNDITRVAEQIYQKSHQKIKGLSVESYGWLFEQFMANGGQAMANNNDGHSRLVTKVSFNNPAEVQAMQWLQNNINKKDAIDFGSGSTAISNEIASFLSGKLGIFLESSAYIGELTAGTKDQLGITYYPHPNGQKANGVAIGGASLWIEKDQPKNVQEGAWQFIKFLDNAQNQAQWQNATGYLAVNRAASQQPILKKLYQQQPEAKVPADQLAQTVPNNTNSGLFFEGVVQERILSQTAMQQIKNGANINDSLKEAENGTNSFIQKNNLANHYH